MQSISIDGTVFPGDSASKAIPFGALVSPRNVEVVVKSESGTIKTYHLKIYGIGFVKVFGAANDDIVNNVAATYDGGFLLLDIKVINGNLQNSRLVKLNQVGDTLWTRMFSNPTRFFYRVHELPDHNILIVGGGVISPDTHQNLLLAKLSASGEIIWEKSIGAADDDEDASDVIRTSEGGFAIAGYKLKNGATISDFYFAKLNGSGDTIWTKTYNSLGRDEYVLSFVETPDNGFLITGYYPTDISGREKMFLRRIDSHGNQMWYKTYGDGSSQGHSIVALSDGYLVAGQISEGAISNSMLMKVNDNGDSLWVKTYGRGIGSSFLSLAKTNSGGYFLAGYSGVSSFNADGYVVRIDVMYNEIWSKTFGGDDEDYFKGVDVTQDGGFVAAGSTKSFGALNKDCFIVKGNSMGETE